MWRVNYLGPHSLRSWPILTFVAARNQANFRPSVRFEIKVTLGGVGVFALHVW